MVVPISDYRLLTDAQIKAITGKDWQGWCGILDTWGGKTKTLASITRYLVEQHGVRRLCAQMIAVYYQWNRCS